MFERRTKEVVGCVAMALACTAFGDSIRVNVPEGRRTCGEETTFEILLLDGKGQLKSGGTAQLVIDNFGPQVQYSNRVDFAESNPVTVKGTLHEPGFLRLSVDVPGVSRNLDDRPYMCSVPYEHEKIVQGVPEPEDFDDFWQTSLKRLEAEVPVDATMVEEPKLSTGKWTMYKVSFASLGRRVYGWMSVPKSKARRWPATVSVPGAGSRTKLYGAADQVRLRISVFPFEPSADDRENERRYDALNAELKARYGVPRYPFAGMEVSREEYFYRPAILGAVRAVRWLAERPEVDRRHIRYQGTSQGGGFGLYLAGLAGDVFEEVRVDVPALTDTLGWAKGRAGGWPHPELEWLGGDARARNERIRRVMPYFDGCNFAARATCRMVVVAGLSDWVCPPSAVCAAYNRLTCPEKSLVLAYGGTHHGAGKIATAKLAVAAIADYEVWTGELPRDPREKVVTPPQDMKLVLLIGQSNMAGRAAVPEEDRKPLARAYKLNRDNLWVEATAPFHYDRKTAGMSPANEFVKRYLADHPGETVGIVPCAVGGSRLATWHAQGAEKTGANFRRALERARIAGKCGKFVAVLWHQGESDAERPVEELKVAYPRHFGEMVSAFRREIGPVPVVVGEIGWYMPELAQRINPVLNALPKTVPSCRCVSAEGLGNCDQWHFDLSATRTLGDRYYEAWRELAGACAQGDVVRENWMEPNYDESKIAPYELEDPLTFADGRKLKDVSEWPARRAEILKIFADNMFGQEPPPAEAVIAELVEQGETCGGFGIRRQYRMWFRKDKSGPVIDWLLLVPAKAKGPVPVFMLLNYQGNHQFLSDPEIRMPEGVWMRFAKDFKADPSTRGIFERQCGPECVFPAATILARGYGVMTACYAQVSPDPCGHLEVSAWSGVFDLWPRRDATPDGRHDGDRLAQGFAPSEFRCKEVASAVIGALGKLDHSKLYASNANLMFEKDSVSPELFAAIFRVVCESGMHLLQPNCASVADLLDAQVHPERHQDIIVKVCGFSARFVTLSKRWQDEIIARHRLK